MTLRDDIQRGDLASVQQISDSDPLYKYSLAIAAEYGQLEIAQWLITLDGVNSHDELPIIMASMNGHLHVLQWLFTHPNFNIGGDDFKGFILACANGHIDVVKFYLSDEDIDDYFDKAYKAAAKHGHLEIIDLLVKSTDELDTYYLADALYVAAKHGHLCVVQYLYDLLKPNLENTMITGKVPYNYYTVHVRALHIAIHYGHVEVVEFLSIDQKPADINYDRAFRHGDIKMIQCLDFLNN